MSAYYFSEDVFKATIKSSDKVAQGLWISFFRDYIKDKYVSSIINEMLFLNTISVDEFYKLIIDFMNCADNAKECVNLKSNLYSYLGIQVWGVDKEYRIIVGSMLL